MLIPMKTANNRKRRLRRVDSKRHGVRAKGQTQVSLSIPTGLKSAMSLLARRESRSVSNYVTLRLAEVVQDEMFKLVKGRENPGWTGDLPPRRALELGARLDAIEKLISYSKATQGEKSG